MSCPDEGTPKDMSQPDDAREDAEPSEKMSEEEMYDRVARILARGALRKAEAEIRKRKEAEGEQ